MELLNKHKHGTPRGSVYIGRGSPLGNPYKIGEHGSRDEVIDKYKVWLKKKICEGDLQIIYALRTLKTDSRLLCFCHPARCHGSVVEEFWNEIMECGDFDTGLNLYKKRWNEDRQIEYRTWLIEKLIARDPQVTIDFREVILTKELIPDQFRDIPVSPVILDLWKQITAYDDYDAAIADLAIREGMTHSPTLDGITHINIYSKAQTSLGRALSNFSHIPFDHPKDGHCESVEGYWYYLKSGRQYPYLKDMFGVNAKNAGKQYPRVDDSDFLENIKEAITCKILQNPELEKDFTNSTLPFSHYYWYGSILNPKVIATNADKWMIDHLEELRERLRNDRQTHIL